MLKRQNEQISMRQCPDLIHINSLKCITTGEYYRMILVLRLSFTKLWIPRKFDRIYFLLCKKGIKITSRKRTQHLRGKSVIDQQYFNDNLVILKARI